VREMILAATREERVAALKKILPMQRSDFVGVFRAMTGKPVTIRLLDPPLHEFLRRTRRRSGARRRCSTVPRGDPRRIRRAPRVQPHARSPRVPAGDHVPRDLRGPGRGDLEAAVIAKREGVDVRPEIMVPLVGIKEELVQLREMIKRVGDGILEREKEKIRTSSGR